MLYLPAQTPNRDVRAQHAYGLREGPDDQPIDVEFAHKWAKVIQEWADRYGSSVAGWWFDGCYEHAGFNEAIAQIYRNAVRHGNPRAIVTFNPGVKVIRWTGAEDYTAGELNDPPSAVPTGRWLEGAQWHALTFLGSTWGQRDTRFTNTQWIDWARQVVAHEGVFTIDMGPNYDPAAGPVGSISPGQFEQARAIGSTLRESRP